jgi:hypothetical protein
MTRFYGRVGYAAEPVESAPGVWKEGMVEYPYYGNVIRNARRIQDNPDSTNPALTVNNSISIVADPYAREHFHDIRYISWAGALWTVTEVEVQFPRLLLRLGGVYNGPTDPTPVSP